MATEPCILPADPSKTGRFRFMSNHGYKLEFPDEPNWTPLESRLGADRCVGFMYVCRVDGRINEYKHGITRTCINLDDAGNCYRFTAEDGYIPANWDNEIRLVEDLLTSCGASLQTAYDDEFRAMKALYCEFAGEIEELV